MCANHGDISKATVYGTFTDKVRVAKDGGVSIDGHGRVWLDCPACGPQAPRTESKVEVRYSRIGGPNGWTDRREVTVHRTRLEWLRVPYVKKSGKPGFEMVPRGVCGKCGAAGVLGRVIVMKPAGAKAEECNGACLSGRRSCSCHCGGRCHGAGTCLCGKAA
jgi:hypothetical protein